MRKAVAEHLAGDVGADHAADIIDALDAEVEQPVRNRSEQASPEKTSGTIDSSTLPKYRSLVSGPVSMVTNEATGFSQVSASTQNVMASAIKIASIVLTVSNAVSPARVNFRLVTERASNLFGRLPLDAEHVISQFAGVSPFVPEK
jgi:hypothetical protein